MPENKLTDIESNLIKKTAAFITPKTFTFKEQKIEVSYMISVLRKMKELAISKNYTNFLSASIVIGDLIAQDIIKDEKTTFIWVLCYYYERMLQQWDENVHALELIQLADGVIDLELDELDDIDVVYDWLISRSSFILAIQLNDDPLIEEYLNYAISKGLDGVVFNVNTDEFFPLK